MLGAAASTYRPVSRDPDLEPPPELRPRNFATGLLQTAHQASTWAALVGSPCGAQGNILVALPPGQQHEVTTCVGSRLPVTILVQGGIASGKSTVSKLLAARGARFLDCDRIAHEVLTEPAVEARLRETFGPGVFGPDGRIDRKALGKVVFDDPAALKALEGLVHPGVRDRVQAALRSMAVDEGERQVAVIDAAVASKMRLTEGLVGGDRAADVGGRDYDVIVFVEVSPDTRRRRAAERGWAPGELERREARQESLTVLKDRADVVIHNDGDLREAESHVERVWSEFVEPRR